MTDPKAGPDLLWRILSGAMLPGTNPPGSNRPELRNYAGEANNTRLAFTAAEGYVGVSSWRSPVLNLRPDLGLTAGAEKLNAIPIWRGSVLGGTTSCFVQIGGISSITADLIVTTTTYAEINAPSPTAGQLRLRAVSQPEDITADFYDGDEAVVLTFCPPAANGPTWFWQVGLNFYQTNGVLGDVTLPLQWAVY